MTRRRIGGTAGIALAVAVSAAPAVAQPRGLEVGAGVATPTGGLGRARGPGLLVRIGAVQADSARRFRLRGHLEAAWMPSNDPTAPLGNSRSGDLRVFSTLFGFTAGQRGNSGFYVLLGVAMQWMGIEGVQNPYGALWGTRTGLGVRWVMRGLLAHAEVAPHAVLSDFGTAEYSAGTFWASTVGLTF